VRRESFMLANWYTLDGVAGGKTLAREKRLSGQASNRLHPRCNGLPCLHFRRAHGIRSWLYCFDGLQRARELLPCQDFLMEPLIVKRDGGFLPATPEQMLPQLTGDNSSGLG